MMFVTPAPTSITASAPAIPDRPRNVLGHLELERCPEVLLFHVGQINLPDDHALIGDAHNRAFGLDLGPFPELGDGPGNCLRVTYLSALDGAGRQCDLAELDQRSPTPATGHPSSPHGARADIESNLR